MTNKITKKILALYIHGVAADRFIHFTNEEERFLSEKDCIQKKIFEVTRSVSKCYIASFACTNTSCFQKNKIKETLYQYF
jgi:hypothetical protein